MNTKLTALFFVSLSLLLAWQLLVSIFQLPNYIIPKPLAVLHTLVHQFPMIMNEAKFTIFEALISLFLAILLGAFTASLIIFIKPARQWLLPTLVIFQAMPTFAIAPLLVLWLGYGMSSKIAITVLMIFFPITNSLYDGLRNTPLIWLDLANIMNASRFQTLKQIQWPAAMPAFASGLRYAAVIAPLGAILGEWVGSSAGLGYLLLDANITLNIDLMFATIIVIAAFTLALYFIIDACLEKCIHWSKQC